MMKRLLGVLLLTCFATLTLPAQQVSTPEISTGAYARVRFHATPAQMQQLAAAGIATDHLGRIDGMTYTGEFSRAEQSRLTTLGIRYDILIQDLETWYAERLRTPAPVQKTTAAPAHFRLGSMGGYLTWAEVVAELDSMKLHYPSLITTKASIGTTYEGRQLWMVKISDNPDTDEAEAEVLYEAMHHAREPMAMMNLIYYMWYLLENYGTNPDVTCLVDSREMFFVPVVNPDGYVYNQQNDPNGGGMWRKNRKPFGPDTGVDINRNYDFQFAFDDAGSSPNPADDTYRGPSAFSEEESQAMRDFCNSRQFKTALSYHSYGNLLIHPWGHIANTFTPDSAFYTDLAIALTADNHFHYGTANQTVGYAVNGGAVDWHYGEQNTKGKIISYTPEIGTFDEGFWPQQSLIQPWCEQQLSANLNIARSASVNVRSSIEVPDTIAAPAVNLMANFVNLGVANSSALTATFVTTDPAVLSVNNTIPIPVMGAGATYGQYFNLSLDPATPNGHIIHGVIVVTGPGMCDSRDSVSFEYGTPVIVFADSMTQQPMLWNGGWAYTTARYHSAPNSMADSPIGDYQDGDFNLHTTIQPIDLSNIQSPRLKFWAAWAIESGWDYVQVLASANGSTWMPLSGQYTHMGASAGGVQPAEPLYDGTQASWVQEDIDLSAWAGGSIYLRFQLISDQFQTMDGFYYDDLRVMGYQTQVSADAPAVRNISLYPNPSRGSFRVTGTQPGAVLHLMSVNGKSAGTWTVSPGQEIRTEDLPAGLYLWEIRENDQRVGQGKVSVQN